MLKSHIITTAFNLFSLNGIKKVSMNDVAQNASVSKRTLYEFFENKESLLMEVLEKRYTQFDGYYKTLRNENTYNALEILLLYNEKAMEKPVWFCQAFLEDIKRYPKANEYMIQSKNKALNEMISILKQGVKDGVFLAEVNFDIIAFVAREHMNMPSPSIERFTKFSHMEVSETFFWVFMRGICTDAGRKILEDFVLKKHYKKTI